MPGSAALEVFLELEMCGVTHALLNGGDRLESTLRHAFVVNGGRRRLTTRASGEQTDQSPSGSDSFTGRPGCEHDELGLLHDSAREWSVLMGPGRCGQLPGA
jgi:hypothetical protein